MNKNKTSIAIALFLMFAMALSLVALPDARAQEIEYRKQTHCYLGAVPNPVGVGQEVLLHIAIRDFLVVYTDGWEGLTVTVERPDGTTQTLGPYRTDSTGGTGDIFIPTMEGTYKMQAHFPEQTYDWRGGIARVPFTGVVLYEASSSEVLELVVQADPVPVWPGVPLPTEYWTRPIDAQFHEWNPIAGNWVATPSNLVASFNDDAPETAHILWAKQLVTGGLAGGIEVGPQSYECGDAYEGKFSSSVILGGVLYYNQYEVRMPTQEVVAVDLRTGDELWRRPLLDPNGVSRRLAFGQAFYWDAWNYHGVFGYLWTTVGTTWHAYNPFSGDWIYSMTNVPSGTTLYGSKGEMYRYTVNLANGWMTLWNSSRTVQPQTTLTSGDGSWRPHGNTYDARNGLDWNVTIPTGLPGSVNVVFFEDLLLGTANVPGALNIGISEPVDMWAISLEPGRAGSLLWRETWQPPSGDLTIGFGAASAEERVFVMTATETRQAFGFNLDTGKRIWGPSESLPYIGIYRMDTRIAYGTVFHTAGMGGVVNAYDAKTGAHLWTYEATDPYGEMLWANEWYVRPLFFAAGKFYLGPTEHSPIDPKPRGAPFVCIDVETGEEVWRADGLFRQTDWGGRAIIGDSIIATMDTYDQRIYAIGKGPSATTVTASPKISVHGSSVLVEGIVADISPGTKDSALTMRFPNGVPAVADESMSEWMQYVYKQFPRPADVVGVEVVVSVLDPNNNCYEVGRTTANSDGAFGVSFEPEVPGMYEVIATFEGSGSYYGSHATTYLVVEEAAASTPEPTPPPASVADVYFVPAVIGIIVAIAVVGVILMMMLRKR